MGNLYTQFLYDPLFNTLIWLYDVMPWQDLGIAIILLTLLIKLLLFYPSLQAIRQQKGMQELQPKLEELKKKYKDDKEELGKQMMGLYKTHKVNPLSSCLPLLIQLPVLIALFNVFNNGLHIDAATGYLAQDVLTHLYEPMKTAYQTVVINTQFLGFVDLTATHNIPLAVAAGAAQFAQAKMMQNKRPKVQSEGAKDEDMAAILNKQMLYVLPVMTIVFGYQFPAGVTLYWFASTMFTWIQQLIFLREHKRMDAAKENAVEIIDVK
jgi:YidC/Oxa1 family membrane protein insertase